MSTVRVESLERLSDDAWNAALTSAGTPFRFSHRAAAGRAFERAYDEYTFEPYRVGYSDGAAALVPLVRARRQVDALTTMLGMPLGLEGTPVPLDATLGMAHLQGLFDALDGCGALTVHGGAGGSPPTDGSTGLSTTHTLDLAAGFDALWSDVFSPTNRNKVRKAEKRGVSVADETASTDTDTYFRIYSEASKKWGYAAPPYPPALFKALLESEDAELWIARQDGEPIAGSILLRGTNDILYWSSSTLPGKQALAPNNALLSAAIRSACERGVDYLDFGASTGLPGVEKFKASFGAKPRSYTVTEIQSLRHRALSRLRR